MEAAALSTGRVRRFERGGHPTDRGLGGALRHTMVAAANCAEAVSGGPTSPSGSVAVNAVNREASDKSCGSGICVIGAKRVEASG